MSQKRLSRKKVIRKNSLRAASISVICELSFGKQERNRVLDQLLSDQVCYRILIIESEIFVPTAQNYLSKRPETHFDTIKNG